MDLLKEASENLTTASKAVARAREFPTEENFGVALTTLIDCVTILGAIAGVPNAIEPPENAQPTVKTTP